MPVFSRRSKSKLAECDRRLQDVFNMVIRTFDCNIECGHRTEKEQTKAYESGTSKVRYPNSKHNSLPSKAVDSYPYVNGKRSTDERVCRLLAGYVLCVADFLGVKLRWGGDWDGDHDPTDQNFNDLVHYELLD